jgi:hypothetical protein
MRGIQGIRPLAALFIILALVGCAPPVPGQGQTASAPYSDDNTLHVRGSEGGGGGAGGM